MKILTMLLVSGILGGCYRGGDRPTAPIQTAQGNASANGTITNDTAMSGGTDPRSAGDDGTSGQPAPQPQPQPAQPAPEPPPSDAGTNTGGTPSAPR